MQLKPKGKRSDHYSEIEDPRIERSKRHKLIALLLLLKAITVSKLRHSFANWGDSTPVTEHIILRNLHMTCAFF
jgi:hypothetical protein